MGVLYLPVVTAIELHVVGEGVSIDDIMSMNYISRLDVLGDLSESAMDNLLHGAY